MADPSVTERKAQKGRKKLVALVVLVPMTMSGLILSGVFFLFTRVVQLPWYWAFPFLPLIYIAWLTLFLLFCARNCERIGKRFPKPRYAVMDVYRTGGEKNRGILTVMICMTRRICMSYLPLLPWLERTTGLRKLAMRAYSPSVHIGDGALLWGSILDPDLTDIGALAVIGNSAQVVAHLLTPRPDGSVVYASAPIKIGARATIGGSSYVSMGCVIGEGAVVEPMSYVAHFTNIPAGETWGGIPARCLRKRDEAAEPSSEAPAATAPCVTAITGEATAEELEQARRLVVFALGLKAGETTGELSMETCATWDSLGQIAIATALYDSYGVTVGNEQMHRLRSLADVANAMAGRTGSAESGPEASSKPAAHPAPKAAVELPADLEMLPLLDAGEATRALAGRFSEAPAGAQAVRVVVASSFTAQPLAGAMKIWGRAYGLELECEFAGYNQIAQTLLSGDSPFAGNGTGVNVVLVDASDRVFESAGQAGGALEELLGAIEVARERMGAGAQLLVGTLPPVVSSFATVDRSEYEDLRREWRTSLEKMAGVQIFDFAGVVEQVGIAASRDSQSEVLSRMPYSSVLYQALGIGLVRRILSTRRSPAKVVALDCDNTLWGGVVGEVGLNGISLGSDGKGRSYQLFQRQIKQLKERGLLLVVVSKNEEADVMRVFGEHPEMVLKAEDIAAWRVNWKHKSENLAELAEELNLGSDSFVLLDDDAAVRMEVGMRLPGVHVVPLPENAAGYCETLERLWLFDGAAATEADLKRTRMMQEEGQRRVEKGRAGNLEEYLAGLQLEVEMRGPDESEWARVAQLTQRTNQFNLSLKRRTVEEVQGLGADHRVLVLKARDRFGDYGLVGACILRQAAGGVCEIDTLLMSCRVLGRGVEDAFLHAMAKAAAEDGAGTLVAPFVEGPRNQLCKEFLKRSGFQEAQPNVWSLPLQELPALPKHLVWASAKSMKETPSAAAGRP